MITIIDYNSGNLLSVKNALKNLGAKCEITADRNEIRKAKKVIFPGQGAAGDAMKNLEDRGLVEVLKNCTVPFLGICLGMQLLFEKSEENDSECLKLIEGDVRKFPPGMKVPQIGWNKVNFSESVLFRNVPPNSYFYFVNSYYVKPLDKSEIASTEYGIRFCSAVNKENFYGVQFHPEKSGDAGQILLNNFIKLC